MLRKYIIFFFCLFLFNQCGFKAIYSEKNSIIASEFRPILISNNSKAVNDAFSQIFININNESDFLLKIDINEKNQPVLTNADGTISKYRIDIDVNFTLIEIETDNELFQSYSKGFAQYETQINNYDTEQKKRVAIMTATRNSLQLIPIKIQNYLSRNDE